MANNTTLSDPTVDAYLSGESDPTPAAPAPSDPVVDAFLSRGDTPTTGHAITFDSQGNLIGTQPLSSGGAQPGTGEVHITVGGTESAPLRPLDTTQTALRNGVAGMLSLPASVVGLTDRGANWIANKITGPDTPDGKNAPYQPTGVTRALNAVDGPQVFQNAMFQRVGVQPTNAQTPVGRLYQAGLSALPMALTGNVASIAGDAGAAYNAANLLRGVPAAVGAGSGAELGDQLSGGNLAVQMGAGLAGGLMGAGTGATAGTVGNRLLNAAQSPEGAAARKVAQSLSRDAATPDVASNTLTNLGPQGMLMDAGGKNTLGLARAVAATPGSGKQIITDALEARAADQPDAIRGAVQAGLGNAQDFYGTIDNLMAQRAQQAAPLYERAFAGGSTAPLQSSAEKDFNSASAAAAKAQQELTSARQAVTVAQAKQPVTGGNVYASSAANEASAAALKQVQAAQGAFDDAMSAKNAALGKLRQTQADAETGARGAAWSPRVQQFLDDPIIKKGLAQGLEIQRLESLAAGKPFNPTEYGITGFEPDGSPIVSNLPNMRLLDAGKRGLDNLIEQYRDPTTGKVVLDQRGRAIDQVRKAYISTLDKENPDYAAARSAWAGPSQSMDALNRGQEFVNSDAQVTAKQLSGMSPSDQEFFRMGASKALSDAIANTPDGGNVVRKIFGSDAKRQALRAVFPSDSAFSAFQSQMQAQAQMSANKQAVLAGSRTAPLAAEMADMSGINVHNALNFMANPKGFTLSAAANRINNALNQMPEDRATAIANLLTQKNPQASATLLKLQPNKPANRLLPSYAVPAGVALTTQQ